jgi:hypothetical protein
MTKIHTKYNFEWRSKIKMCDVILFVENKPSIFWTERKKHDIGIHPKSNTSIQTRFNSHRPRATSGYISHSQFLPRRIAEGEMKGMLTNGNSGKAYRIRPFLQGVRNLAVLQNDIWHVPMICKSDIIYRTWVWTNFYAVTFTLNLRTTFRFETIFIHLVNGQ